MQCGVHQGQGVQTASCRERHVTVRFVGTILFPKAMHVPVMIPIRSDRSNLLSAPALLYVSLIVTFEQVSKQKNTLVQGGQESPSETNPEPEPTSRPAGPALSRAVKRRAKREARDLEEEQAEHRENRHRLFR